MQILWNSKSLFAWFTFIIYFASKTIHCTSHLRKRAWNEKYNHDPGYQLGIGVKNIEILKVIVNMRIQEFDMSRSKKSPQSFILPMAVDD